MSTDRWTDAAPARYDRLLGPAVFAPYADVVAERVARSRPRRVLELAAGTGLLTAALLARLPDADLVATDLDPGMVAHGADRVPGAVWRQADAQDLSAEPAADRDAVVCQFGAMFFPDRPGAYRQARRVLVPGGRLVLAVWDALAANAFPAAVQEALAEVLPEGTPDFLPRVPYGHADPDAVVADVVAAGLRVQEVEHVERTGTATSADAVAEGFCRGTPLWGALVARGDADALAAAVAEGVRARLGDGPVTGRLAAWVVTATT